MPSVNPGVVSNLLSAIVAPPSPTVPEESRISVHAAVSRFSVLYEKIRNAVDYKDDHLLRKAAILRILKRQLILESEPGAIAAHLLKELIGARYLPNGELPESLITEVALRVYKYGTIEKTRVGSTDYFDWLLHVVVVEIEELLSDQTAEKAFVTFLYDRLADRIQIRDGEISATDVKLQVYLACHRSLLKADDDTLSFKLIRAYLPEWLRAPEWLEYPQPIAERMVGIYQRVQMSLRHPYGSRIQRVVKPWAVALGAIRQAVTEKPDQAAALFKDADTLKIAVGRIAERQYAAAKAKLRRGAVRATIYIFLTKMLIAFAVEVPVERMIYGDWSFPILMVNLMLPPFLMFFVALFIHVPGKNNTVRMQENAVMLFSAEGVPIREVRIPKQRGAMAGFMFGLAYAVTYLLIFGLIATALFSVHFTWISAGIFIFFLCTVSFFAFRLRQNAREYVIIEGRQSLRALAMDVISLPILQSGQFIASGINRINVFLFFFDFLLEAPFKIFLTVLEEWFAFLKEKKEEIQ
jgi:hypothetical protein